MTYICISRHLGTESDNRPDLDIENLTDNYWTVLIQGTASNVMTTRGDLRTHDDISTTRFAIGAPGNVLKQINGAIAWQNFEEVPHVFYVAIEGTDAAGAGLTLNAPFRTVKYACEYIQSNIDTDTVNTTLFVKTGIYQEELPIKVPRNCAICGDELRSTVITPEPGSIAANMFYVNNGSGIRNMTLQGLTGTLGTPNQYLTQRPTGGAFVSLDPGTGPDDETVWITTKSCYVQNVTTFGTGCIGMKIDGSLHNGGNRSVVANDFTQVLSDGIGYWALNGGRSELVSVFTYFCHIGYLSEAGGVLRATNGNNSYGTYGSVAEGFSATETPITAKIDNRTLEAQAEVVHTNGNKILAVGHSHAGQEYTSATTTILGTGINASIVYDEVRNNAVSQVRLIDPADSSTPGGLNYQYLLNNAQAGDTGSITLAASDDTGTPEKYIGMRIFLDSGKGVGQYAYISGYDALTKIAIVSKVSDDSQGWEHVTPGWPIAATLDGTTRYKLEPAVTVDEPPFVSTSSTSLTNVNPTSIVYGNGTYFVNGVNSSSNMVIAYSTDGGSNWIAGGPGTSNIPGKAVWTGEYFWFTRDDETFDTGYRYLPNGTQSFTSHSATWQSTTFSDGQGRIYLIGAIGANYVAQYSADHGSTWNTSATPLSGLIGAAPYAYWVAGAAGNDIAIALAADGTIDSSTDFGVNWTSTATLSVGAWHDIAYGNGIFVAVGTVGGVSTFARSYDGVTWYEETIITPTPFTSISYAQGMFMSFGPSTSSEENRIGFSRGGDVWRLVASDSTAFTFSQPGAWKDAAFGTDSFLAIEDLSTSISKVSYGATPIIRTTVSSSRLQSFIVYDPGSNYTGGPVLTIYDPAATIYADYDVRKASGVLAQPAFRNRGIGYITASLAITGDGFADIYQTGKTIKLKNVSLIPGPGANVVINGIDDVTYRLTKIVSQSGTVPNFDLTVQISPTITNQNSPNHEETLIIREQYSQVRLTGHDFLDIGTGNTTSTRYPNLYLEGEDPNTPRQPFNETVDNGGGRVFYTSTDQEGNFRVGELFQVEQATGTVTINADLFQLDGLSELSLGGIQVGGSAVVIREFSKDGTFVANSNNIVPTQAAIITYLESRISSGGADAVTNALIAGQVRVSGNNITTTSGLQINIPVPVKHHGSFGGDLFAHQLFGI